MQIRMVQFLKNSEGDLSRYLSQDTLSCEGQQKFRSLIYAYYAQHKRRFSWRETVAPYHIVGSEIMLQQTQTDRVKGKFELFINTFPTIDSLASASLAQVIACWQGLGYNRRALALHLFAQRICSEYAGKIPSKPEELETFKGIGHATAR